MVCMSSPVSVMSPLLSHTARKGTRAGHLAKMVPITCYNFHYMVPVHVAVKAEMMKCGTEKRDYRTHFRSLQKKRERFFNKVGSCIWRSSKYHYATLSNP